MYMYMYIQFFLLNKIDNRSLDPRFPPKLCPFYLLHWQVGATEKTRTLLFMTPNFIGSYFWVCEIPTIAETELLSYNRKCMFLVALESRNWVGVDKGV